MEYKFTSCFPYKYNVYATSATDSDVTVSRAGNAPHYEYLASLRDTVKAYAKFPIAETAQHAEPLLRTL